MGYELIPVSSPFITLTPIDTVPSYARQMSLRLQAQNLLPRMIWNVTGSFDVGLSLYQAGSGEK